MYMRIPSSFSLGFRCRSAHATPLRTLLAVTIFM